MFKNRKLTLVIGGAVLASVAAFAVIAGTITAQRGSSATDGTASVSVIEADSNPIGAMDGIFGDRDSRVDRSPGASDVSAKLARLVDAGEITQADADALTTWYDARPDITITSDKRIPEFYVYEASVESEALAKLVTEGIITQADSDALAEWATTRPDVDLPGWGRDHDGMRGHGRDFGGDGGFWSADLSDEDYDFAEDLTMLVDKGVLTQADADALQTWMDAMPDVDFAESYSFGDVEDHAAADDDSTTDLASELAEAVAAGAITQADADALTSWLDSVPEVDANVNGRVKSWLFHGEGDDDHEGIRPMLDMVAEFGLITDAQADEIETWIDAMPDFSFNVGKIAKSMMSGEIDDSDIEGFDVSGVLDELVADEVITQADSDALLTWWNAKPEIIATLMDSFEEMSEGFGGEHGGRDGGRGFGARFSLEGASY